MTLFHNFVAPAIVEQLIEQPERLRLGGERRNVTFLFTNIADCMTLTENTEASLRKLTEQYPEDALLRFHLTRLAAGERGRVSVMMEK